MSRPFSRTRGGIRSALLCATVVAIAGANSAMAAPKATTKATTTTPPPTVKTTTKVATITPDPTSTPAAATTAPPLHQQQQPPAEGGAPETPATLLPSIRLSVPNGDALYVDGHLWFDVSSPNSRPTADIAAVGEAGGVLLTNPFGAAFAADPSWAALCPLDSDGDGFTNGEELGDPDCVWVAGGGARPKRTDMLSHPGLRGSAPVDAYPSRVPTMLLPTPTPTPTTAGGSEAAVDASVYCTRDDPSSPYAARDNRIALRSAMGTVLAAPQSIRRLLPNETWQIAKYRLPRGQSDSDEDGNDVVVDFPEATNPTDRAAVCPHLQPFAAVGSGNNGNPLLPLLDWHDPATWKGTPPSSLNSGGLPLAFSNVSLPPNTRVLVSSCSLDPRGYAAINVPEGSALVFADAPIFLRVREMTVRGELLLGSAACPLHSPVTITFIGERSARFDYDNGITAKSNGQLRLHGTRNDVTWTRLAATVLPGTAHVLLQAAVPWGPGDEIVVATSIYKDLAEDQNEVRTVVAVSADGKTLVVDRPFAFRHWASREYQTEVGLLTRSIVLRGGLTATARRDRYGGHTMAHGPEAVSEVVGVRAQRMGQQNILGRYTFHLHLVLNGSRSTLQQSTCDGSYYRCVSVHKTNYTTVRLNVAFNVSANCYYLEDGSEMFNRIEHNLAVRVLVLGTPASGSAQGGEIFLEDPNVAIQPADHAAAGFYISNPHNYVVGNAASGGWAGFAFPIFPYAMRLSSDLVMNPSSYPVLEFDGNTAHSSGHYWGHGACIYFGGRLTEESDGRFLYSNGRYSHPTNGINVVTNLRTWLCNRGLSSWGERVELSRFEAHDVKRSAVMFGQSSIAEAIVTGTTANMPLDMATEGRQGFGFYDTWVQTTVTNTTFVNYWNRNRPNWDRDGVIVDLTHSDIFKPWYISATRNLRMKNVDNALRVGRWVRETGASRMFNLVDWDGSLVGAETCSPTIVGSELEWWKGGEDCWWNANWPAWLCPRKPGREVVGIDMDLPGIQRELDFRTDEDTNELTPSERAQLNIGHVSQFGRNSHRQMTVTRNTHLASGLSGIGWYLYLSTGVPEHIRVWPQNFATTGTSILLAISYPAGTTFDLWVVPRWNQYRTRFVEVASREAVADGNGTMFHFDGRHLYLKVADMWSSYPNAYTRKNVSIPNVFEFQIDVVINATCLVKNSDGFCAAPAGGADPPADLDMTVRECDDPSEQTTPLRPTDLCPHHTDVLPPAALDPDVADFASCQDYTEKWNVWRCDNYKLPQRGYCQASCDNACRVYNPYPHRCSFMEPCIEEDFVAPRADVCGEMNEKPLGDECTLKTCNVSDHGNYGAIRLAPGAPCNFNEKVGQGVCNARGECVRSSSSSSSNSGAVVLPTASRLTDRNEKRNDNGDGNVIEIIVTQPALVATVTATVFASPLPGTAPLTLAMARTDASSAAASSALTATPTAVYRCVAPFPVRRNVTVTITTTTTAAEADGPLTFRFLDWNSVSNVVPSFGVPISTSTAPLSISIDPIDFVASAVFYNSKANDGISGGGGDNGIGLECNFGVRSACSQPPLPPASPLLPTRTSPSASAPA